MAAPLLYVDDPEHNVRFRYDHIIPCDVILLTFRFVGFAAWYLYGTLLSLYVQV